MPNNRVAQITCGVLFKHTFKILDIWGEIADYILYGNKYFSPSYFPQISPQYTTERALYNNDGSCSIRLSANNLIYTHSLAPDEELDSSISQFEERLTKCLIPKIVNDNQLITQRIGILYTCEVTSVGMEAFVSKYFRPEYTGITDFRFSKKESTVNGALWNDKNDFINKIYTVGSAGPETMAISFDYQMHYCPPRQYIIDQLPSIIKTSKSQMLSEVLHQGE